ncbi:MAG: hypothetical protein AAGD04_05900 [Pseudomonadota bacterium]
MTFYKTVAAALLYVLLPSALWANCAVPNDPKLAKAYSDIRAAFPAAEAIFEANDRAVLHEQILLQTNDDPETLRAALPDMALNEVVELIDEDKLSPRDKDRYTTALWFAGCPTQALRDLKSRALLSTTLPWLGLAAGDTILFDLAEATLEQEYSRELFGTVAAILRDEENAETALTAFKTYIEGVTDNEQALFGVTAALATLQGTEAPNPPAAPENPTVGDIQVYYGTWIHAAAWTAVIGKCDAPLINTLLGIEARLIAYHWQPLEAAAIRCKLL